MSSLFYLLWNIVHLLHELDGLNEPSWLLASKI